MRALTLILTLLLLAAPWSYAQTKESDLKTHLLNDVFFLRGLWKNDKLQFDPAGHLAGSSVSSPTTTTPMLALVSIESVQLKSDRLVLDGARLQLKRLRKPNPPARRQGHR